MLLERENYLICMFILYLHFDKKFQDESQLSMENVVNLGLIVSTIMSTGNPATIACLEYRYDNLIKHMPHCINL